MTVDLALIEQLHEFDTPSVAESLLPLGCSDNYKYYMGNDLQLMTDVRAPMVGVALNLEVDTSSHGVEIQREGLTQANKLMRASAIPTVIVMKCVGARLQHECGVGDGMGKSFKMSGCVGLVTDGGARDLDGLSQLGLSVFAAGAVSDHATLHYRQVDKPVTISDVAIHPGDLIHGDKNGVHVIPAIYHHAIVEACCLTRDFETRAHILLRRSDLSHQEASSRVTELAQIRSDKCKQLMAKVPAE